ncbi:hypothetical protein HF1_03070 [Mycoplasma haemofelis str. Langford 1]|uniref:Uncharacterized protein n=1 Tax=Mycoplasma haemofelis (strain Langford 1) TaxID=941640 RepID=E8ZGP4_MYCHL|nr:hypothetical protein [Mycoplasma haemofelis]CBY92315.1 hypothetical protein HF1_03070 [Mycoplasma haemofelis str. Langford 1]
MTSLAKGALGFSAAGTTAAGALYMGGVFKGEEDKPVKTAISKLLKEFHPKKRLIDSSVQTSDAAWHAAWKAYRTKNKDSVLGKDTWDLKEWTNRSGDITDNENPPAIFVNTCSSNSQKEVLGSDDNLYKEVLEFCTRDASIKDWILDSGKKILGDGDNEGWKATWKLYIEKNKGIAKGSDTWQVKDWDPSTSTDANVSEEFKKKCTEKLEIKSSVNNFESEYSLVLNWCTK